MAKKLLAAEPLPSKGSLPTGTISAVLVALTSEAQSALGGQPYATITRFPFMVGRESRSPSIVPSLKTMIEQRLLKVPQLNDLYLVEPPSQAGFHISREHFAIDYVDAEFVLVDRGSASGTLVSDRAVGADSKDVQTELQVGDLIVVGARRSPYVFQFQLRTEEAPR